MYEMKVKTPPMANKRRSWTGRLKDRFKSSAGNNNLPNGHHLVRTAGSSPLPSNVMADDWTSAWVTHPHLQEGHHAPSVPSLQGSVFVAANFVYDYRQKYGLDPASGWHGSVAMRTNISDWKATRGLYPTSPVYRRPVEPVQFRAADVNQNIRQMREHKQHLASIPLVTSGANHPFNDDYDDEEFYQQPEEEDESHTQTTVAVDRPGLVVCGQRICILTGQDSPVSTIRAEKVSLKVEFQRNCNLRRSLSDRARPKMAAPASFHDTTRLTQKSRSRGSLHDLFGLAAVESPPEVTVVATPVNRKIVRPKQPPPPPPSVSLSAGMFGPTIPLGSPEDTTPPVAPPRRIYRNLISRDVAAKSEDPPPEVIPLTGPIVSWTAWSGTETEKLSVATPTAPEEIKRRPVSRLWPSFSSIGRDRSVTRVADLPQEEHIYEEIDERRVQPAIGLSRAGRAGSFAGASRQDILRYLEELRKKHPTGIISVEAEHHHNSRKSPLGSNPTSPTLMMTPSLPQLIMAADDDDDDEVGALLLAMRHNGPNRNSNRSTQSSTSTSTQSSSQDSALSAGGTTPGLTGCYQNGVGGGEIERNDSGVGSETSGTAQRLRRMRRLRSSSNRKHPTDTQEEQQTDPTSCLVATAAAADESNDSQAASSPWCVDCDQPLEPEQEERDSLVCHRCARRRCERREVLAELLETEVRYGRDLRVLQDELYKPLLVAGLVPLRQLDAVFLNVSELSGHSQRFGQRLREAVEIALEQGDEDLLTVDVARLFLDKETEEMMDAFRRYCVRSGEASLLLSTLEKERELLRIFLRASQLENPALRRMDLHAFLMVPVQRITKYPLLLGRLLRATAQQDVEMREALREAQAKVESYLTAINAEAKELGSVSRPWRRGYSVPNLNLSLTNVISTIQRPSGEELMNLRLRKLAMDSLGWSDCAQLALEGFVKLTQPGELLLTTTRSRGRTLKWQNVWMALVTLNHQDKPVVFELVGGDGSCSPRLAFGSKQPVQDAAVVLIKDVKNPRPGPSLFREPLMLSQCTISSEPDELPNFFEIHQIVTKETFICQTVDAAQTQQWLHRLRALSLSLGRWKQRRNALPHVMMIN